jgi:hypothetical protein
MDPSLKKELTKDLFGLGAVFIYLCTILLAAFKWSAAPQPLRAAASIPLTLFIAAYVYKRYSARGKDQGTI